MKRSPHVDNIIKGKGSLFFFPIQNGVLSQAGFHLGNCDTFEAGLEDDVLELRSSMNKSAGLLKKVTNERAVNITISGHEFSKQNFALLFMGDETTLAQAGGPITGETLASTVVLGAYYRTAQRDISAISLEETAGPTALVEGTDYEVVDAQAGVIRILETATNVSAGDEVEIDYTAAAITALDKVRIGTQSEIRGSLLFLSDNSTGDNEEVRFWSISVTPEGTTGLIADEFGNWTLNAEAEDDSAGNFGGSVAEPFGYVLART